MADLAAGNDMPATMLLDWDLVARLIILRRPRKVVAGLEQDWENTAALIWDADINSSPFVDSGRLYVTSVWAVPGIEMDGEFIQCFAWKKDHPGWRSEWPADAKRAIETAL